jgi:hypothetical protein
MLQCATVLHSDSTGANSAKLNQAQHDTMATEQGRTAGAAAAALGVVNRA